MSKQRELFGGIPTTEEETGKGRGAKRTLPRRRVNQTGRPTFTPGSRVLTRLVETSAEIATNPEPRITYQHTVLCQTGIPYRNQGEVRFWERRNGRVYLRIEAGNAMHPVTQQFMPVPLPFGPKARLILIHLNGEALRTGDRTIEVEDNLTAFVKRLLERSPNGPEIRMFRNQLGSLAASLVRLAVIEGNRAFQIDTKVIGAFDLWAPRAPEQRILWPSIIQLSTEYFESLIRHAVPLDERAVAALAHSALGLDIYAWLAQRLHRVSPRQPQLVPWTALHEQFGQGYTRIRKFREVFLRTLTMVHGQYRNARIDADHRGLTLRNSKPPVRGRPVLPS